ncbi:MAG: C40 family peptidase [Bacteroidia bacterium]|nr:C40 family peptidase [Bacteroidia bacterium]NNJ56545.1 C40 family peptidase [Bacteroidia bacterium]
MKQGICHLSQIPVRTEPKSSSEMCTQLLYGETYSILKQEGDWYYIKLDFDGYEGWISDSSIYETKPRLQSVQTKLFSSGGNDILHDGMVLTSMGSVLAEEQPSLELNLNELAKSFLGVPYLWGGRHFSGIDCSGLMQVVYKCVGIQIPRDASQQQQIGKPVKFENLFDGDLIFFDKNEKIGHVGMYIGNNQIIHSHGYVRIDELTRKGIKNSNTGLFTHSYHSAKRLR